MSKFIPLTAKPVGMALGALLFALQSVPLGLRAFGGSLEIAKPEVGPHSPGGACA